MRISALIAGATLAFGLAACSDSSPDATSPDVTPAAPMTFTVKSIDGQPLPFVDTVHNTTEISWAFTLNPDGTWVDAVAYIDGTARSQNGTYTVSGSTLTFMNQGKPYSGTLGSGTFSLNFSGHTAVFQQF